MPHDQNRLDLPRSDRTVPGELPTEPIKLRSLIAQAFEAWLNKTESKAPYRRRGDRVRPAAMLRLALPLPPEDVRNREAIMGRVLETAVGDVLGYPATAYHWHGHPEHS